MEYILDVDSTQRDPVEFPNPNDYTVSLNTPLYNVTDLSVITGRIPNTQLLINNGNKQFQITDGVGNPPQTIILNEGTFATGGLLASNLQADLSSQCSIDTVLFNPKTKSLDFSNSSGSNVVSFDLYGGSNGYVDTSNVGTPYNIMGFNGSNVSAAAGSNLLSNVINLDGPLSILVRVTAGEDDLETDVFTNGGSFSFGSNTFDQPTTTPLETNYIGRILCGSCDYNTNSVGKVIEFNGNTDKVQHHFYKGPQQSIEKLRFRFYWNNCNKLIPYDFGNRNHILKLKVTCSLDKFQSLSDQKAQLVELPKPVELPYLDPPKRFTKEQKIIMAVCVAGLVLGLLVITSPSRR